MTPSMYFGLAMAALAGVTWASGSHPMQKMWWVFFGSWIASNVIHDHFAPPPLMSWNAVLDFTSLLLAIWALWDARKALYVVLMLYMAMLTLHFAWTAMTPAPTYYYRLGLNILFALQLLTIGGISAYSIVGRFVSNLPPALGWAGHHAGGR